MTRHQSPNCGTTLRVVNCDAERRITVLPLAVRQIQR